MYNEIINDKILSEYGEDMSLIYDLGFDFDNLWVEVNEEIENL